MAASDSSVASTLGRYVGKAAPWRRWCWPLLGLLGGLVTAWATRLPLAVLPLVDEVTYAQDNALRARAVMICAVVAAVWSAGRDFRRALLFHGLAGGLLLASALEKWRDYQQLAESAHVPPGAGELTQQYAAVAARTLVAIHLRAGAFLLPAGCLLGIVAAMWGSRHRDGSDGNRRAGGTSAPLIPPFSPAR